MYTVWPLTLTGVAGAGQPTARRAAASLGHRCFGACAVKPCAAGDVHLQMVSAAHTGGLPALHHMAGEAFSRQFSLHLPRHIVWSPVNACTHKTRQHVHARMQAHADTLASVVAALFVGERGARSGAAHARQRARHSPGLAQPRRRGRQARVGVWRRPGVVVLLCVCSVLAQSCGCCWLVCSRVRLSDPHDSGVELEDSGVQAGEDDSSIEPSPLTPLTANTGTCNVVLLFSVSVWRSMMRSRRWHAR